MQDLTERKRAEAELRARELQIAHLNRVGAMGEFTASLAHELNQPLAAILSNAQAASRFLNSESPDLTEILACLADIVAADKRAGDVIKRVRAMLKKEESEVTQVDLNAVVADVIRLLQNDAILRRASIASELSPNLPVVLGDRVQLYQVVLNLIVNGLEASAEQKPSNRWLRVRTSGSDASDIELTVEDSGKGIVESELAHVFTVDQPVYCAGAWRATNGREPRRRRRHIPVRVTGSTADRDSHSMSSAVATTRAQIDLFSFTKLCR
jgi:C4-dicarboxylate-specific signal transduction histidine kinase